MAKVLTFSWPWVEPETYFELVNVQQRMVLELQGYVIAEKKEKEKINECRMKDNIERGGERIKINK